MEIGIRHWYPALASPVSGAPGESDEEATHETQSMFCFAFSLDLIPSSVRQENLWPPSYLFSGLRSSLLLFDREVCAGTNLCWRCACFSPTSEGSATSSQSKPLVWQWHRVCTMNPWLALVIHGPGDICQDQSWYPEDKSLLWAKPEFLLARTGSWLVTPMWSSKDYCLHNNKTQHM